MTLEETQQELARLVALSSFDEDEAGRAQLLGHKQTNILKSRGGQALTNNLLLNETSIFNQNKSKQAGGGPIQSRTIDRDDQSRRNNLSPAGVPSVQ